MYTKSCYQLNTPNNNYYYNKIWKKLAADLTIFKIEKGKGTDYSTSTVLSWSSIQNKLGYVTHGKKVYRTVNNRIMLSFPSWYFDVKCMAKEVNCSPHIYKQHRIDGKERHKLRMIWRHSMTWIWEQMISTESRMCQGVFHHHINKFIY